jgi:hypothetical protein
VKSVRCVSQSGDSSDRSPRLGIGDSKLSCRNRNETLDSLEEFKKITMDVLKRHPLAEYIAEQVYQSSSKPNVRDCVRMTSTTKTEQDVLRMLRISK